MAGVCADIHPATPKTEQKARNGKDRIGLSTFKGSSQNLHVVERFKPIDSNTILYRATVEDPSVYSKPWVIEYPFNRTPAPIYEDACHEGNYALPDILKGARKAEAESAKQ